MGNQQAGGPTEAQLTAAQLQQDLVTAAKNGDIEKARQLFESGANINKSCSTEHLMCLNPDTPLTQACRNAQLEMVLFLLQNGADINYLNDKEYSALDIASSHGHRDVVDILLQNGAKVDIKYKTLGMAASCGDTEIMKTLLAKGASVFVEDDIDLRGAPIHFAVEYGHIEAIKLLLSEGAKLYGNLVDVAIYRGHIEVLKFLAENGQFDLTKRDRLFNAASNNRLPIVKFLVEDCGADILSCGDAGRLFGNVLHEAAKFQRLKMLKYLIEEAGAGKLLAERRKQGAKAPHEMAPRDSETAEYLRKMTGLQLNKAVEKDDKQFLVDLLLAQTQLAWSKDGPHGYTAFHLAVALGKRQMLSTLCYYKPHSINIPDYEGNLALHIAVLKDDAEMVNMLVNRKDINMKNLKQQTPLHLLSADNAAIVKTLLGNGADVNVEDSTKSTSLLIAASKGLAVSVALMLATKEAHIDNADSTQFTPLHYAATKGHATVAKLLASSGASLSTTDSLGNTPLHLASQAGHNEVVKELLQQAGALQCTSVQNANEMTPLDLAFSNGHEGIVNLYQAQGAHLTGLPARPVYFKNSMIRNCPVQLMSRVKMNEYYDEHHTDTFLGSGTFGKERCIAYVKNVFFLPILALGDYTRDNLTLMYPFMERGDLQKALDSTSELLPQNTRVMILWQIARALEFLHRSIQDVRTPIIHGDVKPSNILLDAQYNARLGDAGLAVEIPLNMTHVTGTHTNTGTYPFIDPFALNRRRDTSNDVFSYGVVVLMMLSGKPATVQEQLCGLPVTKPLYVKLFEDHRSSELLTAPRLRDLGYVNRAVWIEARAVTTTAEILGKCVVDQDQRIDVQHICELWKDACTALNYPPAVAAGDGERRCVQCMVEKPYTDSHASGCPRTCHVFCKQCFKLAFRNPLVCPYHGNVEPPIGHSNAFAILIVGHGKDARESAAFKMSIQSMYNTIEDKQVMGIRDIRIVNGKAETYNAFQEVSRHSHDKDLSLLVYYSGHSSRPEGREFELCTGSERSQHLSASWLRARLGEARPKQLLVILDCCYSAAFSILPNPPPQAAFSEYSYTLWASSSPVQKSWFLYSQGLVFTKYVVSALRSGTQCPLITLRGTVSEKCQMCEEFCNLCKTLSILTVSIVQKYVFDHLQEEARILRVEQYPVKKEVSETHTGAALAYANPEPLAHIVWLNMDGDFVQPLKLKQPLGDIAEIKKHLMQQINAPGLSTMLPTYPSSDHLMLGQTDRRGISKEIFSADTLRKSVIERGEVVWVQVRTRELYITCNTFHQPAQDSPWLLEPRVGSQYHCSPPCVHLHSESGPAMTEVISSILRATEGGGGGLVHHPSTLNIQYSRHGARQTHGLSPWFDVWSMDLKKITSEDKRKIEELYNSTQSQRERAFFEDIISLLNMQRTGTFEEHHLVISISAVFVEYQEQFKL